MDFVFVSWWCPRCGEPQSTFDEPCSSCGHEYVSTWKCNCGTINENVTCASCRRTVQDQVNSDIASRYLTMKVGQRTMYEHLRAYIVIAARRRHIPPEVMEEAWSIALERIMRYVCMYDNKKGDFAAWASVVARNALLNAARDDMMRNSGIMSLDGPPDTSGADENAESLGETLVGETFDIGTIAEKEWDSTCYEVQIHLAQEAMGRSPDGIPLWIVAVEAMREKDGRGWLRQLASMTGMEPSTISRRIQKAREIYREWQKKQT